MAKQLKYQIGYIKVLPQIAVHQFDDKIANTGVDMADQNVLVVSVQALVEHLVLTATKFTVAGEVAGHRRNDYLICLQHPLQALDATHTVL